jgi:hypothetical protein
MLGRKVQSREWSGALESGAVICAGCELRGCESTEIDRAVIDADLCGPLAVRCRVHSTESSLVVFRQAPIALPLLCICHSKIGAAIVETVVVAMYDLSSRSNTQEGPMHRQPLPARTGSNSSHRMKASLSIAKRPFELSHRRIVRVVDNRTGTLGERHGLHQSERRK